jgi:hypothetical protein
LEVADPLYDFAERKTREASSAEIHALVTTETGPLETWRARSPLLKAREWFWSGFGEVL